MNLMLIPQFSLRWLLATVTGFAFVFLIVSFAVRGNSWAAGISVGILGLFVALLVYGLVFFLVWLFAIASDAWRIRHQLAKTTGQPARARNENDRAV
jgi:membrane protein YdbS with pleckstrin-like domain